MKDIKSFKKKADQRLKGAIAEAISHLEDVIGDMPDDPWWVRAGGAANKSEAEELDELNQWHERYMALLDRLGKTT